jgi:hypothetical protein
MAIMDLLDKAGDRGGIRGMYLEQRCAPEETSRGFRKVLERL